MLVSRLTIAVACTAALSSSLLFSQTTTVRFDGLATGRLSDDYGDRVDGPNSGGYTYDGTGGFTPNIVTTFGARNGSNSSDMFVWPNGYNDLTDVVYFPYNFPAPGGEMVVTLTADVGYSATIEAFDLGNFGAAITLPYVRVVDQDGTVLFEELNVALNPGTSPDERSFSLSPVPSAQILQLRIATEGLGGNADNVGLDNFTFGQITTPPIEIGTAYCQPGVDNATGGPTGLRAWGSDVVADNDILLVATGMRIETFGFFLTSRTQGFVAQPGGSLGNLCVLGAIGRYVGQGQIQNTRYDGNFSLRLDLMDMPQPTGSVVAQVGETWNFQAWHRDFSGTTPTSNFSEALSITMR